MAEKKTEAAPAADDGGGTPAPAGKTVTKMEAVRRSMARLGHAAKPRAIQADIRDRSGVELSTDLISTYKREIIRQAAPAARKPQAAEANPPAPARAAAAPPPPEAPPIRLDDVLAVKALVERVGAEQLRRLIAAFER